MDWLKRKLKEYWNLLLGQTTLDEKVVETYNEAKEKLEDVIEDIQEVAEEVQDRVENVKEEIQDVKDAVKEVVEQSKDVVNATKGKKRRGRPKGSKNKK